MSHVDAMIQKNRERSTEMIQNAIQTMRRLYEKKEQVTVQRLTTAAGCSRAFFYKNAAVAEELNRVRELQANINFTHKRKVVLDKAAFARIQ